MEAASATGGGGGAEEEKDEIVETTSDKRYIRVSCCGRAFCCFWGASAAGATRAASADRRRWGSADRRRAARALGGCSVWATAAGPAGNLVARESAARAARRSADALLRPAADP